MERGCDIGGVDGNQAGGEAQVYHPFTKVQLSFLLGISLTKEQAYDNVSKTVSAVGDESFLLFRLRGDMGLDMHAGGGNGIDVTYWIIQNSYTGKGIKRRINPRKVIDLVFRLRDEAAGN
ncbi:hypothetical protein A3B60_01625 [Candidatus Peregrinibacteria bacterium RIFCSPLOWO2_01_FULL_39_12]|nr:MAG: hypothetical protein A3B60_01625 [Candidatus Peregrinibacteria bacterium RIFCSPLOWO2_01_FULL_39_12]OGJ42670.1 MAG: hypothetical protein A3I58_02180 [Candidatus Peregrinibacteria bacterium RIFCSPLOWO2_02_FULL_39_10]